MEPKINEGIYTILEASIILGVNRNKLTNWLKKYLESDKNYYSWRFDKTDSFNFNTLMELRVMFYLNKNGLTPKVIYNAHQELVKLFKTNYPFTKKEVLESIKYDGKMVFIDIKNFGIITLDKSKQFNIKEVVNDFLNMVDFDEHDSISVYYPLGTDKSITVDPKRKFGKPTLKGLNISPFVLYQFYQGDNDLEYIAELYEIEPHKVKDAIEFCKAA